MKIKILDKRGVESSISPENIIIDGVVLKDIVKNVNLLRAEVRELKYVYERDVKELENLWKTLKLY